MIKGTHPLLEELMAVRTKFLKLATVAYQDMDPEKYSLSCRIRIRIRSMDPNPGVKIALQF